MNNTPPKKTERFAVLWMPTLAHECLEPIDNPKEKNGEDDWYKEYTYTELEKEGEIIRLPDANKDIELKNLLVSDNSPHKVFIDLTLKEATKPVNEKFPIPRRDILIKVRPIDKKIIAKKKEEHLKLELECLDARRNGLFLYQYEYEGKAVVEEGENEYFALNRHRNITHAVYHAIKNFYHVHQYHDEDKDSLLTSFGNENYIELTEPDNLALLHYLSEFEKMFSGYAKTKKEDREILDSTYKCALERKKEKKEEKYTRKDIEQWREEHESILVLEQRILDAYAKHIDDCSKILSKHVYFQTLFFSKYNTIYKKAINVHNAVESIKLLKSDAINHLNTEYHKGITKQAQEIIKLNTTADKLSKQAKKLSIAMAIVAFLAIGLDSVFFSCSASKSQVEKTDSTQTKILKHLQKQDLVLLQQLRKQDSVIQQQIDSIESLKKLIGDLARKNINNPPQKTN